MCTCITVYLKHVNYVCAQSLSRVRLFATLWTVATRLLYPWNFPGKNTRVGCHFLLHLHYLGMKPVSLASPALAGRFFITHTT